MSMMPLPGRDASVSTQLEAATRLFRATLFKLLPEAMIAAVIAAAPAAYAGFRGLKISVTQMPQDPTYFVVYLCSMIAVILTVAIIIVRQNDLLSGLAPSLAREIPQALRRLPSTVLAIVLASLLASLGTSLLLTPGGGMVLKVLGIGFAVVGLWLSVCFTILNCIVVLEPVGPIQALMLSVQRIRPLWWKACAIFVIGLLVAIVCAFAAGAIVGVLVALVGTTSSAIAQAVQTAIALLILGMMICFLLSLVRVLYSSASSSA